MKTLRILLFFTALLLARPAHADSVTTADRVDYVQDAWGIATDGSDAATYFSDALGQQYQGIPFSDYVTMLIVSVRIGAELDAGNYHDAAYALADYASDQAVNVALESVNATGLFGVASFAAASVEFGLSLFVKAVGEKTFNEQCVFYFVARGQLGMSAQDILNHPNNRDDILFDDSGWIHTLPDQTLSRKAGTPLFFVDPPDFFAVAEKLYQAKLARDGQLASDNRTVREAFRQVVQPTGPVITSDLDDQTITDAQTATFSIVGTGSGTLTYRWYQNGALVAPAVGASFIATAAGIYQVIVTDGFGRSAHSRIATLTVNPASGSVALTAPSDGAILGGNYIVRASALGATKVEFWLDGSLKATKTTAPYTWTWNTATAENGPHTLVAKAFNGVDLLATTPSRSVTVNNVFASSPDLYEANNSSPAATALPLGSNLVAYVGSPSDVDWFKLTVANAGLLLINLQVPGGQDFDLELYGPDGTWVVGSYSSAGVTETIQQQVATLGTYYVRVMATRLALEPLAEPHLTPYQRR